MKKKLNFKYEGAEMTLGPYKELLLMGGGALLRDLCVWAKQNGFGIRVITAPRHADEELDGIKLSRFLKEKNIPHMIVKEITSPKAIDFINDTQHAFCLSMGAAWIFDVNTINDVFQGKLFNIHGTRMPQNRGGGGFSWQILTANRFGFCVLHAVDGGVDTGDIIAFEEFLYPASCRTPQHYWDVYTKKNFSFITGLLEKAQKRSITIKPLPQMEYFSSYWPRLHTLTNAWIDWSWDAYDLERFICAFDDPYAGAQTFCNERKIHIKKVSVNFQDGAFHSYQSGLVYRKSKSWLCVCVKNAGLIIEDVRDENGASLMDSIKVGDRFYTPNEQLENIKHRVLYNSMGRKLS